MKEIQMTNLEKLKEIESTFEAISQLHDQANIQTNIFLRTLSKAEQIDLYPIDELYKKAINSNKVFFEFTHNNMKFFIEELMKCVHPDTDSKINRVIRDSLNGIFGLVEPIDPATPPVNFLDPDEANVGFSYLKQMINHRYCLANVMNLVRVYFLTILENYYKTKEESEMNKKDD